MEIQGVILVRSSLLSLRARLMGMSDYVFDLLWKKAGCPQLFLLDLRPVNYVTVFVASHDIAEQISKVTKLHPTGVTKSPTIQWSYGRLVGKRSLLSEEVIIFLSPSTTLKIKLCG